MDCLEKYRRALLRETNKNLRVVLAAFGQEPEQDAVHDFRVGVKRLTALYRFLNAINADLDAKQILKPYRSLFKSMGNIREGHIAVSLVQNLAANSEDAKVLVVALKSKIRKDYRLFKDPMFQAPTQSNARVSIKMPTVRSTGISETAIRRYKRIVLNELWMQILSTEERMNAKRWHKKRILLKRYRHTLDAFQFCSSKYANEEQLKQIKILEQLLGDWHDRVVTISLLQSLQGLEAQTAPTIAIMKKQHRLLLGSAKIYMSELHREAADCIE